MAVIANLDIILGAKTDKMDVGIANASKKFTDLKKQLTSVKLGDVDLGLSKGPLSNALANIGGLFSKIHPAAIGAAAGTAAVAGAMALLNTALDMGVRLWQTWVAPQFEAVDQLAKEADVLGLTVAQMQAYRNASEAAGLSAEELGKGMKTLNQRIQEAAQGGTTAEDALRRIGLSSAQLAGLSIDEQTRAVADALAAIADPGEKAAASIDLFGKAGGKFVNFLGDGAGQIDDAAGKLKMFGLELSRVDAARIEDANDRITDLKQTASGLGALVAVEVAPAIAALAETMFDVLAIGKDGDLGSGFRQLGLAIVDSIQVGIDLFALFLANVEMGASKILLVTSAVLAGAAAASAISGIGDPKALMAEAAAMHEQAISLSADSSRLLAGGFGADFAARVRENQADAALGGGGDGALVDIEAQDAAAKEAAASAEKLANSVDSVTQRLANQVAMFGQSATAMQIYELRQQGATDAQVAMAEQLGMQLQALEANKKFAEENAKAMEQLAREGEAVFKNTQTPLEQYSEKISDLQGLLTAGVIDQQTFSRAVRDAQDGLKSGVGLKEDTELNKFAGLAGALTRGSAEAFKASQQNSRDDLVSKLAAASQKQIEIAEQQKRALERIARDIGSLGTVAIVN